MSPLGWIHLIFAFVAMGSGAVVLLRPKGTRWHRTWGHLFVTSMIGLNGTALAIYDLLGHFGPFHVFALISLGSVLVGMACVLFRWPKGSWIEHHAGWMAGAYMGLMAAFVAETSTRLIMPALAPYLEGAGWAVFWSVVAVASLSTIGVGVWLIRTRMEEAVENTPAAMRREREELKAASGAG